MRIPVKNFFKIVLYLVCLFIFFEMVSRAAVSFRPFWDKVGNHLMCDAAWRIHWIKKQEKFYNPMMYQFDEYHPLRGWTLKANLRNQQVFSNKILNSNSKGIRGSREYSYQKPEGKLRVVVLGDSYTFGEEVSDSETFSAMLEKMLPDAEVINLGIHGYGHDQMLLYFKEEGVKYHPDIVILGFRSEDAVRNLFSFRDYAKPRFNIVNGRLQLTDVPVPAPQDFLKNEKYKSKFWDLLTILHSMCLDYMDVYVLRQVELMDVIFQDMVGTIKDIGAEPVFVYLDGIRWGSKSLELEPFEKEFVSFCGKNGMHSVMVRQYFLTHYQNQEEFKFKMAGHWDRQVHEIVARAIEDYLVSSGLAGTEQARFSNSLLGAGFEK